MSCVNLAWLATWESGLHGQRWYYHMLRTSTLLAVLSALTSAVQIYDMYGEEGLKGGAPPPGAAGGADGMHGGMPGGMPDGASFFSFGGPGGGYSGMDSARAANIFASLFGQHGGDPFGGGGGGAPRSRVNMFSRNGRRGMADVFGDGAGTHYFHDGGTGARPAGSGTTGYAWGGGGECHLACEVCSYVLVAACQPCQHHAE